MSALFLLLIQSVPAGRYARSLRLILRRARRAKVIPAASGHASPTKFSHIMPMTSISASPAVPAFSPSSVVNAAYLPTPGGPTPGGPSLSPSNLIFSATSQLLEDSPQSAQEISEFDFLFAQENLERSGLQLGEGDPLPL